MTDDGALVTLPTVTIEPVPTNIYAAVYSIPEKRLVMYALGHPDDFPLTYNLRVEDAAGTQLKVLQGEMQLSEDDETLPVWYLGFGFLDLATEIPTGDAAILKLKGTLSGSRGNTVNVDRDLIVSPDEIGEDGDDGEPE